MTKRFLAVAFAFATTFAMANNGQEENVNPTTVQTEQTQQVSYEEIFKRAEDEDALYCEITRADGTVRRCVLCKCEDKTAKLE